MLVTMNLLGWMTLIIGFSGVFSQTVPKWMGLVVMAIGALTMFSSWSHARAKPYEPLLAGLVLAAIVVLGFMSDARAWFPGMVLLSSVLHFAGAADNGYHSYRAHEHDHEHTHGGPLASRAFFWRRHRHA